MAYEKKEAPKLRHISRSELKRMTEIPMPDLMMGTGAQGVHLPSLTGLAYVDTRTLHHRHRSRLKTALSNRMLYVGTAVTLGGTTRNTTEIFGKERLIVKP